MRAVEYRWLVLEHSLEIYGGIVAAVFASLGIWLGLKLTRERVVVREVPVPAAADWFATRRNRTHSASRRGSWKCSA